MRQEWKRGRGADRLRNRKLFTNAEKSCRYISLLNEAIASIRQHLRPRHRSDGLPKRLRVHWISRNLFTHWTH